MIMVQTRAGLLSIKIHVVFRLLLLVHYAQTFCVVFLNKSLMLFEMMFEN